MEKYSKYLPSKNFIRIAGLAGASLVVFFVVAFLVSGTEIFNPNKKDTAGLQVSSQDFANLIIRDTDGDGIADWEEELWGTDKNSKITFENTADATYIASKKRDLNVTGSVNTKNLTETEKFAREFFTSYSALKSSGEVDEGAIQTFSNILGETIIDPTISNIYRVEDLRTTTKEDLATKQAYYVEVQDVYTLYLDEGIGNELEILSTEVALGEGAGDSQKIQLRAIAEAYQDFGKDITKIQVPLSLASYHLAIVNNAHNTGVSIANMSQVINDPIVGLSGLSQYQQYSDALVLAVSDLEEALVR